VTVNMGFNSTVEKDVIKAISEDLAMISGQRPVITKARKSISNFKLRKGMPVGAKVTLRGDRMYDFLTRLIHAALPRIRDFRGLPVKGFDGRGSYTFGLQEQTIFPEIDPDGVKKVQGMNVTVVTSANTDERARQLLTLIGVPFAKAQR
jgi:large subunit ribosomal protein L5